MKRLSIWEQLVEQKKEWIGGKLKDYDTLYGLKTTKIKDIVLSKNGDSYFFKVVGERYSCGFNINYGGIAGIQNKNNWLILQGYGGHTWGIIKKENI